MKYYQLFICLITVTAIASFINYRYIRLPKPLFLTFSSVMLSLCIILMSLVMPVETREVYSLFSGIDFRVTTLNIMLGYLFFADALRIESVHIKKELGPVIYLASLGVVLSAMATGVLLWFSSYYLNLAFSLYDCLTFGALISPLDAVVVVSIFKDSSIFPRHIQARIIGEALFNDSISVMLLIGLTEAFYLVKDYTFFYFITTLIHEFCGAMLCGLLAGWLLTRLLKQINDNELTILITISLTSLSYIIAQQLNFSPVITMVVIGLYVGQQNKNNRFLPATSASLNHFWELIDGILNAFMFVLIGLEMLTIPFTATIMILGIICLILVFIARYFSIFFARFYSV